MNEHALHAALVDVLAEVFAVEPDASEIAAERDRFQRDRRLATSEDLDVWRRSNDLNAEDFDDLIHRLAARRLLRRWLISRKYLERTTQEVLDQLRLRGRYPAVADAAANQQDLLEAAHPDFTFRGDDSELLELIRAQAKDTGWRPNVPIDVWAFENGFKDVYDVRFELVRAKLARTAAAEAMSALFAAPTS